ncbi:hypothetical protein R50073_09930 [Maricurvus nonylphenolicus]|uniref:PaaI family thioesterase n=1 Tax=Maricurvus nonylphenolicus TaxID=1008307 RepID=UPI0036F40CF6
MNTSFTPPESFHYMDTMRKTDATPSSAQEKRRQMATAMQKLINKVARMQASEAEMARYVEAIEDLSECIADHDKFDSVEVFKQLYQGKASVDEFYLDIDSGVLFGKASPVGFPMELNVINDKVVGTATIPVAFQGPPQRVHGGIVAAVFDILLSRTQGLCDFLGFTADLQVSYKSAVPLDTPLQLEAWVEYVDERKLRNAGHILVDGKIVATAQGLWVKPKQGFI